MQIGFDRIQINTALIVLGFIAVLLLESQSAASYPTYFLSLFMLIGLRNWNDVFSASLVWWVGLFLIYMVSSSFWSEPFEFSGFTSKLTRASMIFLFVVAMAECQLRGTLQRWMGRALSIAGVTAAVAALIFYYGDVPWDGRLRGLGQLDNAVVAGLIFGVVLLFLIQMILNDNSRRWRLIALVCAAIVLWVIFLTGSRNVWVSVTLGSLVFIFSSKIEDQQKFFVATVGLSVILGIILLAVVTNEELSEILLPRSDSFRFEIWANTFEAIRANAPIFGHGLLTSDDVNIASGLIEHPHNMYLAILFQGGAVGLALFIVVLACCLRILMDSYHMADAKLALGIFAMALYSYLLDGHEIIDKVGETWFLFWIPVGISLGLSWRAKLAHY